MSPERRRVVAKRGNQRLRKQRKQHQFTSTEAKQARTKQQQQQPKDTTSMPQNLSQSSPVIDFARELTTPAGNKHSGGELQKAFEHLVETAKAISPEVELQLGMAVLAVFQIAKDNNISPSQVERLVYGLLLLVSAPGPEDDDSEDNEGGPFGF